VAVPREFDESSPTITLFGIRRSFVGMGSREFYTKMLRMSSQMCMAVWMAVQLYLRQSLQNSVPSIRAGNKKLFPAQALGTRKTKIDMSGKLFYGWLN